jgi:uracil-DNA glycosylase family 4
MNQRGSPQEELGLLTRQLRAYLEALQSWGVQHVPGSQALEPIVRHAGLPNDGTQVALHSPKSTEGFMASEGNPPRPTPAAESPLFQNTREAPLLLEGHPDPLSKLSLAELEAVAKQCTQCRLQHGRTHVVFGVGNPHAELMFAGEAPGRDEDLQGEPFVGRAGQLLTRIIEAIGMKRQEVYIANVVKCRPPNNRNPEADEIARCEPYLVRQIELVKPRIIVALGTFAAQTLLKTKQPISQLRGRFHTYQGVKLMPTFHPAFLLRNPERKRAVWEDMQAVQRELRQPRS